MGTMLLRWTPRLQALRIKVWTKTKKTVCTMLVYNSKCLVSKGIMLSKPGAQYQLGGAEGCLRMWAHTYVRQALRRKETGG